MLVNQVIEGDCLSVMVKLPDNCIDTIITDPPYSLNFMNKDWDGEIAFNPKIWHECLRVAKPGATLMAFGGTRTYHRLVCAIEDAGWQIRDCISYFHDGNQAEMALMASLNEEQLTAYLELHYPNMEMSWVYGSGFPKSHNVSKGIDKANGAEREVVGDVIRLGDKKPYPINGNRDNHSSYLFGANGIIYSTKGKITAPSTPLAAKFSGWGSALKPAHEQLVCARKPLSYVPNCDIITETNILLGAMLCLLLLNANDVERVLKLSPAGRSEESVFVAVIVSLLDGERSGALSARMATFKSPETVSMCLSIAKLWNSTLGEILNQESKFTIKMGTAVTTALKTLNSLILPIIPDFIIQGKSQVNGSQLNVGNAEKNLNEEKESTKVIPKHFVAEIATWKTDANGTTANNAAKNLQLLIPSVNSVLCNVHRDIITGYGQIKSQFDVQDAKENSRQSPQARQNIAANNVISKTDKPLSPAHEPIVVAMKPMGQGYAANAAEWGVAGMWIDGGRIYKSPDDKSGFQIQNEQGQRTNGLVSYQDLSKNQNYRPYKDGLPARKNEGFEPDFSKGRYPANVVHSGEPKVMAEFDKAGVSVSSGGRIGKKKFSSVDIVPSGQYKKGNPGLGDTGTAARYFAHCPPDEPAPFHYCPKASPKERGSANNHPTVKPLSLVRYLVRLTRTPDGGIVLDPFAGSGTTALACIAEDRDYILIEKEPEYAEICRRRIAEYTGQEITEKEIELTKKETVKQLGLW